MSESERSGIDPATGKPLAKGVWYRGAGQYQARKMVDGKRLRKTFASSALARRWLTEKRAEVDLLASIIQHAISEWDIHMVNHASARVVKRPQGADPKRSRRLAMLDSHHNHLNKYDGRVEVVSTSEYADTVWPVR